MFERGAIPQSDDSLSRQRVPMRSVQERQNDSFFQNFQKIIKAICCCKAWCSSQCPTPPSDQYLSLFVVHSYEYTDSLVNNMSERLRQTLVHQPKFSCWILLDELCRKSWKGTINGKSKSVPVWMWFIFLTVYSHNNYLWSFSSEP